MAPINHTSSSMMKDSFGFNDFSVPISTKGHFFQDDFFKQSRERFLSAVQNVMSRWDQDSLLASQNLRSQTSGLHNSSLFDTYRNLRLKDLREDNQAVTVTREGNVHKVSKFHQSILWLDIIDAYHQLRMTFLSLLFIYYYYI